MNDPTPDENPSPLPPRDGWSEPMPAPAPAPAPPPLQPPLQPPTYAPPQGAGADLLGEALTVGWRSFASPAWPLLLVSALTLIGGALPGQILSLPMQFADQIARKNPGLAILALAVGLLGSIVSAVLVQWPAQVGAASGGLAAVRGRTQEFRVVLDGFRRLGTSILAMLLLALVSLGAALPGLVVAVPGVVLAAVGMRPGGTAAIGVFGIALAMIGLLVAMAGSLYVSARLIPLSMRVVDPELPRVGAVDAFTEAWRMTKGHALSGVGVLLIGGAAILVGFCMCCIGALLFGLPLVLAFNAAYYEALRARITPAPVPAS